MEQLNPSLKQVEWPTKKKKRNIPIGQVFQIISLVRLIGVVHASWELSPNSDKGSCGSMQSPFIRPGDLYNVLEKPLQDNHDTVKTIYSTNRTSQLVKGRGEKGEFPTLTHIEREDSGT